MADNTGIEWTDATWNPVTGCTKVSPGCAHCYAERVAVRLWPSQYPDFADGELVDGIRQSRPRQFTDVMTHEDRLDQPLRWKKPRRIFVNSMSDLFHEDVPDAFIDRVFAVMALAPQHTFQVLTKRAKRMCDYMNLGPVGVFGPFDQLALEHGIKAHENDWQTDAPIAWPLPNVWFGVSVENQHFADERIPLLLQTPAAVRFISAEPLLGPIDLHSPVLEADSDGYLDWVIVGGESGPGARRFDIAWARAIVQQCQSADVPVFVKQLGAAPVWICEKCDGNGTDAFVGRDNSKYCARCSGVHVQSLLLSNPKGGDISEWPSDLRVREFPRGVPR